MTGAAAQRAYYRRHKDRVRAAERRRYAADPEKHRAAQKRKYWRRKLRDACPDPVELEKHVDAICGRREHG